MRNESAAIYHFHPERIGWIGTLIVAAGLFIGSAFLWIMQTVEAPRSREIRNQAKAKSPYLFSLNLSSSAPRFAMPDLQGKIMFSFDPPRPDGKTDPNRILVRLRHSAETRCVHLPCRIPLEYQKEQLKFASAGSLFWIDLASASNGQIQVNGWIKSTDGSEIPAGQFLVSVQECPMQEAHELSEGSPMRRLAEAKWWGRDLFKKAEDAGERLELSELLEVRENEWLIWREGRWEKAQNPDPELPAAKIQKANPKMLVLEGWDTNGHTRIGLGLAAGLPFKMKGEELFSTIRVRSEKQISCMMEKQCLVLKVGDWVLKTSGRWKILRKKEERDSFLNGKLFGEFFILDQIMQKNGQKVIQGRLFNPGRTQVVPIEMAAQGRKSARKAP